MSKVILWAFGGLILTIVALVSVALVNDYLRQNTVYDFVVEATGKKLKCTSEISPSVITLIINTPLNTINLETIDSINIGLPMRIVNENSVKIEARYSTLDLIARGAKINESFADWLNGYKAGVENVKNEMKSEQDAGEPWVEQTKKIWASATGQFTIDRTTGAAEFFEPKILWPDKGLKKPKSAPELWSRRQKFQCEALEKSF